MIISADTLLAYWSVEKIGANLIVFANLLGSMILGLMVGYERSYHGRAAGMRTYGLVCMASTALVVIVGYPEHWFGGAHATLPIYPDLTRVIQGIVTGIGFLGAGVIMQEGFSISGLTTAASIWASSAIGILVGVGFYFSAILLTLLASTIMMWGYKLEQLLPSRHAIAISLTFRRTQPNQGKIKQVLLECEYSMAQMTISVGVIQDTIEWHFVGVALSHRPRCGIPEIAQAFRQLEGLENYHIAFARN